MITLLAALLLSQPPVDMPPSERLARARVCFAAMDFGCATDELAEALGRLSELPVSAQKAALRLSAETALSTRRDAEAQRHLEALLRLAPHFKPQDGAWPPAWREVLARARLALPDTAPPTVTVRHPMAVVPGEPVDIEVDAQDRSGVSGVSVWVSDGGPPLRATTTDGRHWRARIPGRRVGPGGLRIWVEATDQRGNGPTRWGTARAPHELPIKPRVDGGPSVTETWWFWTAVGGAALIAAGGITAWALTRDSGEPAGAITAIPETGAVKMGMPEWWHR